VENGNGTAGGRILDLRGWCNNCESDVYAWRRPQYRISTCSRRDSLRSVTLIE